MASGPSGQGPEPGPFSETPRRQARQLPSGNFRLCRIRRVTLAFAHSATWVYPELVEGHGCT